MTVLTVVTDKDGTIAYTHALRWPAREQNLDVHCQWRSFFGWTCPLMVTQAWAEFSRRNTGKVACKDHLEEALKRRFEATE